MWSDHAMEQRNHDWPGVTDPGVLEDAVVDGSHRLADAARGGAWDTVLQLVGSSPWLGPNQWRIGGTSWFAPLHQAAWLGAPVEVVERLLAHGAWRSLRTADGDRPVDLARRRGHGHLVDALATPDVTDAGRRRYDAWDRHLDALVGERTSSLDPVAYRPVATEVLGEERLQTLWFPFPGMYGGFSSSVHRNRLVVESWCRVVGGSGQAHVITEGGCVLVEEGFV